MLTTGLTLCGGSAVDAIAPVTSPNFDVEWSKVVKDPFDGAVVYDKHFDPGGSFEFVSRWSPQEIQATYRRFYTEIVGYRTVWQSRSVKYYGKYRTLSYPERYPVYRRFSQEKIPTAIKFAINGQVLTYEQGSVSPELAAALASAPNQNMTIRLVWENGGATDMTIGRGTVAAWKTLFGSSSIPATGVQ